MKLLRPLLAIVIIILASQILSAQMSDTIWTNTLGGSRWDEGSSIRYLYNSGYIISGYSASFGDNLGDFYLARIDYYGNVTWQRTYGGEDWDWGHCVTTSPTGGFAIVGYSQSYGEGIGSIYFVKINSDGEIQWTKTYDNLYDDDARCVQISKQPFVPSGYIICGWTNNVETKRDVYLIRTDYDGDTLWTKCLGEENDELGYWISQAPDYGYAISGAVRHGNMACTDMLLMKTDPEGNIVWSRNYGGNGYECAYQVIQDSHSGGYILIGDTESYGAGGYDVYLVKTDANGDTVWTRNYGGEGDDHGYKALLEPDGYIIVGKTESYGAGDFDIFLLKVDIDGNLIGHRTYGGNNYECGFSILKTGYNEYTITGTTGSYSGNNYFDAYVLKVKPNFTVGVDDIAVSLPDKVSLSQNYPNPFNAVTNISFDITVPSYVRLELFNVLGEKLSTLVEDEYPAGNHAVSFDANELSSGVYFYRLDTGDYTDTKKMLLLK